MTYNVKVILTRVIPVETDRGLTTAVDRMTDVATFSERQSDNALATVMRSRHPGWEPWAVSELTPEPSGFRPFVHGATTPPPHSAPGAPLDGRRRNDPSPSAVQAVRDAVAAKERYIGANTDAAGNITADAGVFYYAMVELNDTIAERAANL